MVRQSLARPGVRSQPDKETRTVRNLTAEAVERARRQFFAREIALWTDDGSTRNLADEIYFRILDQLIAATGEDIIGQHAKEHHDITAAFEEASKPLRLFLSATGTNPTEFWSHLHGPLTHETYFNREALEWAVADYLAKPARSDLLDWLLLDALIATELLPLANALHSDPSDRGLTPHALDGPSVGSYLSRLVRHTLFACLVLASLALVVKVFVDANLIEQETAGVAVLAVVGIPTAIVLASLRPSDVATKRERDRCRRVLSELSAVYASLAPDTRLSTAHLRATVLRLANQGVVWPPALMPLLEDLIRRRDIL